MITLQTPEPKHAFPVFIFLSICGFYFIAYMMIASKAPDRFLEVHKASKVPLSLFNFSTFPPFKFLDKILMPLISFFVAAFGDTNSAAYPTVVDFVWSFGSAIQVPLLEAQRDGVVQGESPTYTELEKIAVKALSYPMIWGILYQRLSGGWIMPLWFLCFMYSPSRLTGRISQIRAESVLFGWWAGHTIPGLIMLVPGMPEMSKAPAWVAFPILMSVAQSAYLYARRELFPTDKSAENTSGYIQVQFYYLSALVASAIGHIHVVLIPGLAASPISSPSASTISALWSKFAGLVSYLYNFYTPAAGLRIPKPEETTAVNGVVHFVQWDVIIVFATVWVAMLWDLYLRRPRTEQPEESYAKIGKTAGALFLTSMLLGHGTATAGLCMYREALLRGEQASVSNGVAKVKAT